MININRNNYEEYFVDFMDGKLTSSLENQLRLFLDQNPDLKEELEMVTEHVDVYEEVVFGDKQKLRKETLLSNKLNSNFDELCIGSLEGDLSVSEQLEFNKYLEKYPQRNKEYKLYTQTKFISDNTIIFPHKSKLKSLKLGVLRKNYFTIISAAASVIVLFALYILIPKNGKLTSERITAESVKSEIEIEENQKTLTENNTQDIKKLESITARIQETNIKSNKVKLNIEDKQTEHFIALADEDLKLLSPLQVKYDMKSIHPELAIVFSKNSKFEPEQELGKEEYVSVKSYLAETFNKRVLRYEKKDKIGFFDIAQAGVKGINKLTGSNMKLQRIYDENGIPDKTEFNSKLIAFSTPIKKD